MYAVADRLYNLTFVFAPMDTSSGIVKSFCAPPESTYQSEPNQEQYLDKIKRIEFGVWQEDFYYSLTGIKIFDSENEC